MSRISKCSLELCPRCKIGKFVEHIYDNNKPYRFNVFDCRNCRLRYSGDDGKNYSLNIEYSEMGIVSWKFFWRLSSNCCESQKWGKHTHQFISNIRLLPLDIPIEEIKAKVRKLEILV